MNTGRGGRGGSSERRARSNSRVSNQNRKLERPQQGDLEKIKDTLKRSYEGIKSKTFGPSKPIVPKSKEN